MSEATDVVTWLDNLGLHPNQLIIPGGNNSGNNHPSSNQAIEGRLRSTNSQEVLWQFYPMHTLCRINVCEDWTHYCSIVNIQKSYPYIVWFSSLICSMTSWDLFHHACLKPGRKLLIQVKVYMQITILNLELDDQCKAFNLEKTEQHSIKCDISDSKCLKSDWTQVSICDYSWQGLEKPKKVCISKFAHDPTFSLYLRALSIVATCNNRWKFPLDSLDNACGQWRHRISMECEVRNIS